MKISAVLLCASLLIGCATIPEPVTVEVPIPVPCRVPEVAKPELPVDALAPGADIFEVVRALWASIEVFEAYSTRQQAAIEACR